MNVPSLRPDVATLLNKLPAFEGVGGCSVARADTGITGYHARGLADAESTIKATVEFREIQGRLLSLWVVLASLQSAAYALLNRVFALSPAAQTVL